MEIKTLKDMREALSEIPDKFLENFGAGIENFEGGDIVKLLVWGEEDEVNKCWEEANKKYPQLSDISKWIENICKEDRGLQKNPEVMMDRDEPISSEDKIR